MHAPRIPKWLNSINLAECEGGSNRDRIAALHWSHNRNKPGMTLNLLHIDEQKGWRGGEQQVSYLVNGLAERDHRVYVAGRSESEILNRPHLSDSITRLPIPLRNEMDLVSVRMLARAIIDHRIDIIHAHTSHSHMLACLAQRWARHGKVLVSRRVDFPPKRDPLNRLKYAMPDGYVAISGAIRDVLVRSGVDAMKVQLVHSAIDPSRFNVAPLSRAEIGVPEDAFLIGNVAALVGHKDQATLIRAMHSIVNRVSNAHLVIAGEGTLRGDLERLIGDLKLQERVHLLGYRQDVPRLLRALDAFVMSSKEEGLGTSVLDAMASGIPVAATSAGGIPEMVIHESTGLLVPIHQPDALADAVVRLAGDEALRVQLVKEAARIMSANFTIPKMITGNESAYEALLDR
jgi:L-malate glycosyltransferase